MGPVVKSNRLVSGDPPESWILKRCIVGRGRGKTFQEGRKALSAWVRGIGRGPNDYTHRRRERMKTAKNKIEVGQKKSERECEGQEGSSKNQKGQRENLQKGDKLAG